MNSSNTFRLPSTPSAVSRFADLVDRNPVQALAVIVAAIATVVGLFFLR